MRKYICPKCGSTMSIDDSIYDDTLFLFLQCDECDFYANETQFKKCVICDEYKHKSKGIINEKNEFICFDCI